MAKCGNTKYSIEDFENLVSKCEELRRVSVLTVPAISTENLTHTVSVLKLRFEISFVISWGEEALGVAYLPYQMYEVTRLRR